MLEIAVLGLLKEQDMHGYELKKRLSEVFGLASAVSFGSLYPALSRLEAAGAIHVVEGKSEVGAAGSGSTVPGRRSSRRRKVYGLTGRGSEMFEELLSESQTGEDERSFSLRLAFARYLPLEARLGLLERRRAVLGERLAQLAARARARARRDDRYMRILAERQQEALSRDVSWLDSLIREERERESAAGGTRAGRAEPADASARVGGVQAGPSNFATRLVPLASASQLQRAVPAPLAPRPAESGSPEAIKGETTTAQ